MPLFDLRCTHQRLDGMRYLLIVVGERAEKRVLERYGMVVDVQGSISTYAELDELELAETEL